MNVLARVRGGLRILALVELGGALALLGLVVCLVFGQVVARYVFGEPQAWVEELCTYAFIWIVFLGAGVAMKLDRHIRVTTLEGRLGRRGKVALRLLGMVVASTALAVVAAHAARFVPVEMRSTSVALPVAIPRAFFFSIPLVWACVSISLAAAYITVCDLVEMHGGRRLPPILGDPSDQTGDG